MPCGLSAREVCSGCGELALQNKNQNRRSTCCLLLPKLISGELDLSALPEPEAIAA